jgi:hypothetical protein
LIAIMLRDMRWRILIVALLSVLLYFLEPAFHQHGPTEPGLDAELGPLGVSAALAYLAGLSMIVLLTGFVASDVSEGYSAIHFSHPTSPLAYYGLRWLLALTVTLGATVLFLLLGQVIAWGEVRGGGAGILLGLLAALVYGGLMAFFSTLLRSGDGWVVFILFLPTPVPQILTWIEALLPEFLYQIVLFFLPPQNALQEVYRGLLLGDIAWPAVAFAGGYGMFWLVLAALLLRTRERF